MRLFGSVLVFISACSFAMSKNVFDYGSWEISDDDLDKLAHPLAKRDEGLFEAFSTNLMSLSSSSEDKAISIFSYYLRDNYEFLHDDKEKLKELIVFIPTDQAVKELSAKPWEFPLPIEKGMSEKKADEVSKYNILSFLKSHLINITDVDFKLPDSNLLDFESMNKNQITIKNMGGEFFVTTMGLGKWLRIEKTQDNIYQLLKITLIIIDGTLDWPEKY